MALFGVLIILVGCGTPSLQDSETIKIAFIKDPSTQDPRKAHDLASTTLCFMLYEGLFRHGPQGNLEPALCESYQLSKDKKVYLFKLKKSYWSDGSPLTACDFEKAWLELLDPQFISAYSYLYFPIKNAKQFKNRLCTNQHVGIKAIDTQTLRIELESPKSDFIKLLSFSAFHPFKILNGKALTNGPFKIKHKIPHQSLTLVANPFYHSASLVEIKGLEIKILDSESTALQLYKAGLLDVIGGPLSGIPCEDLQCHTPDFVQEMAGSTLCVFNTQSPIFKNLHMRKAFAYAIDFEEIKKLSPFQIKKVESFLPKHFTKDLSSHAKDKTSEALFHLEQGLLELGMTKKDLYFLSYYYGSKPEHNKIAQILHACWKKNLDIDVNLIRLEAKNFQAKLSAKDFDMAQVFWLAPYDSPLALIERFHTSSLSKNFCNYECKRLNQIMEQLDLGSIDDEKAIFSIEEIFSSEVPFVSVNNWHYPYYTSNKIAHLCFTNLGTINFTFLKINKDTCSKDPS